jgi:hypothetical protein
MTHGHKAKIAEGEGVGPTAKGQRKRTGCEQFFYFLLYDRTYVQKAWRANVLLDSIYTAQGRSDRVALEGGI